MFSQGIDVYGFDREFIFTFYVLFTSSLGIAKFNPICGTVGYSAEFVFFDESFQKDRFV